MTPLGRQIDQILKKHHISFSKILRLNNRFLVAKCLKGKQPVIFKILISKNSYEQDKFGQALNREAKLLNFLNQKGTPLIERSVNDIIDFQKADHSWYIKTFFPGKAQKVVGSGWFYDDKFFTQNNIKWLTDFFHDLYKISDNLPADIKRVFRASNLSNYEKFLDWENVIIFSEIAKLPLKNNLKEIKKFFVTHRKIFDRNQIMINHFEPYADHLITNKGQVTLIDWENSSFGDVAHDIAVVWSRAFNHPTWQKQLVKNFVHLSDFRELFNLHVILQSLGNIRYFFDSPFYVDNKEAPKQIKILQKNITNALNDKLI